MKMINSWETICNCLSDTGVLSLETEQWWVSCCFSCIFSISKSISWLKYYITSVALVGCFVSRCGWADEAVGSTTWWTVGCTSDSCAGAVTYFFPAVVLILYMLTSESIYLPYLLAFPVSALKAASGRSRPVTSRRGWGEPATSQPSGSPCPTPAPWLSPPSWEACWSRCRGRSNLAEHIIVNIGQHFYTSISKKKLLSLTSFETHFHTIHTVNE